MRDVNHVSDPPDRICNGQVIVVNAGQRIRRERRAKEIIRLEIANRFPQRRQQLGRDLQTGLSRRLSVGQAQQFEFVAAELGRGLLLLQPDAQTLLAQLPRCGVYFKDSETEDSRRLCRFLHS